ncbi:hypothetical protein P9250_07655 [Caballeronia sp. LP006]|uniref:hypothetical protein n=1 Tax=unclassified Caballeronia TaxID=2646786 RepID=UPI001FD37C5C|nr:MULTISPECIES: hypothetical protein [unclassified Caballeronia]MDR5827745.1 hypothetical protein [Caballeronia sp. LP006]
MLTIKDLAASKELGRAEMGAITGGSSFFSNAGINSNVQAGGLSFASPQANIAPVTQVDASTTTNVDLKTVNKSITAVGSLLGGMAL